MEISYILAKIPHLRTMDAIADPILPQPLPATYEPDERKYGSYTDIVKAVEAGYTLEPQLETEKMVDDTRRLTAMVWHFRYNAMPDNAKRACMDIKVKNGSMELAHGFKRLEALSLRWRNAQVAMPANPMVAGIEDYWFISFVSIIPSKPSAWAFLARIQMLTFSSRSALKSPITTGGLR